MPCPVYPSTTKSQAQSFILFNCTENIIIMVITVIIISGSSSNKSNSNYNNNDNKLYIDIKLSLRTF